MQALIPDLHCVSEVHLLVLVPSLWRVLQEALDERRDIVWGGIVILTRLRNGYQEVVAKT